jgi:hypothetical protein
MPEKPPRASNGMSSRSQQRAASAAKNRTERNSAGKTQPSVSKALARTDPAAFAKLSRSDLPFSDTVASADSSNYANLATTVPCAGARPTLTGRQTAPITMKRVGLEAFEEIYQ